MLSKLLLTPGPGRKWYQRNNVDRRTEEKDGLPLGGHRDQHLRIRASWWEAPPTLRWLHPECLDLFSCSDLSNGWSGCAWIPSAHLDRDVSAQTFQPCAHPPDAEGGRCSPGAFSEKVFSSLGSEAAHFCPLSTPGGHMVRPGSTSQWRRFPGAW